jgi:hypothetical protein
MSIPYDSPLRWPTSEDILVATPDQMRKVTARLLIKCPDCNIILYHQPKELYVAWQLHEFVHHFEVKEYAQTFGGVTSSSIS